MPAQFAGSVTIANEYTLFGTGTLFNQMTIGASASLIKCGASVQLAGRTTVTLKAHPDNSGYIYIGFDSTVTASKWGYVLAGGDAITFTMDTADNLTMYAYGSAAGQLMGVTEGIT